MQIKKSAKQLVTSKFAKMMIPVGATILWRHIIGVIIAFLVFCEIFILVIKHCRPSARHKIIGWLAFGKHVDMVFDICYNLKGANNA